MRRAAILIAILVAGSARAGDWFTPPEKMTRFVSLRAAVPRGAHLVETRAIPGLGQVWRFATGDAPDTIVLAADGAWWLAPPVVLSAGQGMGGRYDEVTGYRTRLDLTVAGGRSAVAITAEARSSLCHGRGDGDDPNVPKRTWCDEPRPVTATLVCARTPGLACEFVVVNP